MWVYFVFVFLYYLYVKRVLRWGWARPGAHGFDQRRANAPGFALSTLFVCYFIPFKSNVWLEPALLEARAVIAWKRIGKLCEIFGLFIRYIFRMRAMSLTNIKKPMVLYDFLYGIRNHESRDLWLYFKTSKILLHYKFVPHYTIPYYREQV